MLCFESGKDSVFFYRRCLAYAKRRPYRAELVEEFPVWALLHWTPVRSRVDLLFIDFLRSELGASGSERRRALAGVGDVGLEAVCPARQEQDVFVGQCLAAVSGRDRVVLEQYVLGDLSLAELAETLGVSKTRAVQCSRMMAKKLRMVLGE